MSEHTPAGYGSASTPPSAGYGSGGVSEPGDLPRHHTPTGDSPSEKSIDDLVEEWHRLYADKPPEQVLPLHEYLGMSRDQYHQWVLDPDSLNNDATTNDDNDESTKETGHGSD